MIVMLRNLTHENRTYIEYLLGVLATSSLNAIIFCPHFGSHDVECFQRTSHPLLCNIVRLDAPFLRRPIQRLLHG